MKKSAYTVIELLITISILLLMSSFFKYNSVFLEEMRFENSADKIMSDIGYLQSIAVNSKPADMPWIEFDVSNGLYECYEGDGNLMKDPFNRKEMSYRFYSDLDEKNFRNVSLENVLVHYTDDKNKEGNSNVEKIEYNWYGGLKVTASKDGDVEEYDNEDADSADWDQLEIVLENQRLGTEKTIIVEPLTLDMYVD